MGPERRCCECHIAPNFTDGGDEERKKDGEEDGVDAHRRSKGRRHDHVEARNTGTKTQSSRRARIDAQMTPRAREAREAREGACEGVIDSSAQGGTSGRGANGEPMRARQAGNCVY